MQNHLSIPSPRHTRWAIALLALGLGGALLATSWNNYTSVRHASDALTRGQARLFVDNVRTQLRSFGGPPTNELMEQWLQDQWDNGIRFVAVGTDEKVSAGTALYQTAWPPQLPPGQRFLLQEYDSRMVVVASRKRIKKRRRPLPTPKRPRLTLVLEFKPVLANQLNRRAQRNVTISLVVALLLACAAVGAFRWLGQKEKQQQHNIQQQHLANLGQMSAVLAHEIRNPLASLKGHAQLLEESLIEDEKKHQKATRVVQEAIRIEHLTTDLLDFVRTGAICVANANPMTVLQSAASETQPERIQLSTPDAPPPTQWPMDADRIRQALTNLLQNALEASPSGTQIHAIMRLENDRLTYEIRDQGPGIPSGQEQEIFTPFHTNRVRGTGLGLAITKRIIDAHGGTITVHNPTTGGAAFTVTLPRLQGTSA